MGMNSACLQRCSALLETAALHARAWKNARTRCIQAPRQAMELGTGRRANPESSFSSVAVLPDSKHERGRYQGTAQAQRGKQVCEGLVRSFFHTVVSPGESGTVIRASIAPRVGRVDGTVPVAPASGFRTKTQLHESDRQRKGA